MQAFLSLLLLSAFSIASFAQTAAPSPQLPSPEKMPNMTWSKMKWTDIEDRRFDPSPTARVEIPRGESAEIDGKMSHLEWDDAAIAEIRISHDLRVTVFYKHDGKNLQLAFRGLPRGYAVEIAVDPEFAKTSQWVKGQRWFHAGARHCDGDGDFRPVLNAQNELSPSGAFCSPRRDGWMFGGLTLSDRPFNNAYEVLIPFEKAGIPPNTTFGLTFAVTPDMEERHTFPPQARIESPFSWARAKIGQKPLTKFKPLR